MVAMNIGSKILSIEFSDEEKNRIGSALLNENSICFRALNTKFESIDDMNFWRQAQKRFKVTGFRNNSPHAKALVVQRAMAMLRNNDGADCGDIWPLYRNCAVSYAGEELEDLNKLLYLEAFEEETGTVTEQIFKNIKAKLPLYSASTEDLHALYELWGFDRIENFSSIFSGSGINADLVKRMISKENNALKQEIFGKINNIESEIKNTAEAQEEKLSKIIARADSLQGEIEQSISKILHTSINNSENVAQSKAVETESLPQKDIQELDELWKKIELISSIVEDHETLLQDEKQKFSVNKNNPNLVNLNVAHVFERWQKYLNDLGISGISKSLIWTIYKIFLHSKIIVTQKPKLLTGLFKDIPSVEVMYITASPLWTSELDWKIAYDFISIDSINPRILVISDFDVAIQEIYLIPALSSFITSGNNNRIILVPSASELKDISEKVLELSVVLDIDSFLFTESSRFSNLFEEELEKIPTELNAAEFFKYFEINNLEFERELRRLSLNAGAILPSRLAERFISIFSALNSLDRGVAWRIASDLVLMPWVESSRSLAFRRLFEETLKIGVIGS